MKRFRSRIGSSAAITFSVLVVLAPACSFKQQYGYVQSGDQSLSFRHPVEWVPVDVDPTSSEWVAGVDASAQPAEGNQNEFILDAPFVLAQVYPLEAATRDSATLAALRSLGLTNQRDPLAGEDPSVRVVFHEPFNDPNGFEGHHMRLEVDLEDGTAVHEQIAVFDPERTRIQRVRVACSLDCFEGHASEIDALFDSVRLRP